jgi:hypothetical protein
LSIKHIVPQACLTATPTGRHVRGRAIKYQRPALGNLIDTFDRDSPIAPPVPDEERDDARRPSALNPSYDIADPTAEHSL